MRSIEEKGRVIADLLIEWQMTTLDAETIGQILVSATEQYAGDCNGFAGKNRRTACAALARRAQAAAQFLGDL